MLYSVLVLILLCCIGDGSNVFCVYATLYFSDFENLLLEKYPEIQYYKRYIDDIFGIWLPLDNKNDDQRWINYINKMNTFGKLKWEFIERCKKLNFLDITIEIDNNDGKIMTSLYEKPENFYLYLPANSNHPAGVLKGLVYGMIYRTLQLSSNINSQNTDINNLFTRLLARGYEQHFLLKIINKAYNEVQRRISYSNTPTVQQLPNTQEIDTGLGTNTEKKVFFHIEYHPEDPTAGFIQNLFYDQIYYQTGLPNLPDLTRPGTREKIGINRLIVCYHRFPNIGNLCSPRRLKAEDGPLVSTYTSGN
jgi:hypothetical protein